MRRHRIHWYLIVFGALSLILQAPLLLLGYIFALDMVFTPVIPMPDVLSNGYVWQVLLHVLSLVIPGEIIEKLILVSLLWLAGIGAYRLARLILGHENGAILGCYMAGIFYMINPFVYSRLMAGQYLVLLGYALLPFFVRSWMLFLREPGWRKGLLASLWLVAISVVSIHTFGMAILAAVLFGAAHWWPRRKDKIWQRQTLKHTALAAGAILLACSYWLAPALLGHGATVGTIAEFSNADLAAFATTPTGLGWLGNVLALQGFWADGKSLYLVPMDIFSWWWVPWIAVWGLVVFGMYKSWQKRRGITAAFASLIFIAAILAIGAAGTIVAPLNQWLVAHVPFFAGYREPQKFVALIALGYAYFGAVAVAALAEKVKLAVIPLFALPLAIAPLLPGFYGQLTPRQYPPDWFATNNYLQRTDPTAKVLFLPWHMYMPFSFAGRDIANPAQRFFKNPTIISNNPEMAGAKSGVSTNDQQEIQTTIVPTLTHGTKSIAANLRMLNIRYVILAKELDYKEYARIELEDGIKLVRETETLKLYTVTPR
jgi:hypothetical protein